MVLRIASGRAGYKSSTDPYLSLETVCHNSSASISLEERRCQLANLSQHSSRLRDYRLLELESLQLATAVLFIASDDCVSITNSIAEVPVPSITQLRYYVGPSKNTAFFLSRCFSAGNFSALNETQVHLADANFHIVATNVSGESEAGYLLGISWSNRSAPNTIALARVDGSPMLMKQALENLWSNFEAENGSVVGKKLALVNIRYDSDASNYLLLYSKMRVSVRADVVEFIDND